MGLARREKLIVAGGLGAMVLLVGFQIVVKPRLSRLRDFEEAYPTKLAMLRTIQAQAEEHRELTDKITQIRATIEQQSGDIWGLIQSAIDKCGLAQRTVSLKALPTPPMKDDRYVETVVEVRADNVPLQHITEFLLELESSEAVLGIRHLDLRRTQDGSALNMALVVASIGLPTTTERSRPAGGEVAGGEERAVDGDVPADTAQVTAPEPMMMAPDMRSPLRPGP
jgi:type II secretory pathway component PulM